MFESVQRGPADPMFDLKKQADSDTSSRKVDLGVGIYRNEQGQYHEFGVINEAKKILDERNPGHDYESTTGNAQFLKDAATTMFGSQCTALASGRITTVQTISGTGANHLAALLLSQFTSTNSNTVYVGTPAWGNYEPLCQLTGLRVQKYRYYDTSTATVDFTTLLDTVRSAPRNSIFILQGCCHNPTGADLTPPQWETLADVMADAGVFPFFDIAYQGLATGMDEDAYGIRLFVDRGFEMLVCQSFSKNLGLYGERCGALHVVSRSKEVTDNVYDRLRCLIRWEFSSSPAYGSRLVSLVVESERRKEAWVKELAALRGRLNDNRTKLHQALQSTPGNWDMILTSKGLFCYLPLSPQQCQDLRNHHHIYLPDSGRINISGLNDADLDLVVAAIGSVVQSQRQQESASL